MKVETITYLKDSTSSAGAAWAADSSAPECTASMIKNCVVLIAPAIIDRHKVVLTKPIAPKPLIKIGR